MGRGRRQSRNSHADVSATLSQQALDALSLLVQHPKTGATGVPADTLHREFVGLILRTVWLACAEDFGMLLGPQAAGFDWRTGDGNLRQLQSVLEEQWTDFARQYRAPMTAEPVSPFFGRVTWLDGQTLCAFLRLLLTIDAKRLRFDELDAETLGHMYEGLLAVRVERVSGTSVCLAPHATWILIDDVLREDAEHRPRWLQRRASLPKTAVQRLAPLATARREVEVLELVEPYRLAKTPVATRGRLVLQRSDSRKTTGSHYTPRRLTEPVVERALAPLVEGQSSSVILDLCICDAAMGAGAFLLEACRYVARHLAAAWSKEKSASASRSSDEHAALRAVAERTLYGVDRNPIAVEIGRFLLGLATARAGEPWPSFEEQLLVGDALVDREIGGDDGLAFAWQRRFSRVFSRDNGGFDAFVGNPPWVAYAGRAAQPLDERLAVYYRQRSHAFSGYPTLHGLFVWRTASLLRSGGRLGLVLPTSVADLAGYAPTRRSHDAFCDPDTDLTDFGDGAFVGVFQPCMALTSTRRTQLQRIDGAEQRTWPLERPDLSEEDRRVLDHLAALPSLSAKLFGERGYQSAGDDLSLFRRSPREEAPFSVPLREGSDIGEFIRRSPTLFADTSRLAGRFRKPEQWQQVKLLIRQTARYPIAALSDGAPFRNSILAGFADARWSEFALLCYLNSSAVRWYHYFRHRDARQGMPQLKIAHLRALPDLKHGGHVRDALHVLGRRIGARNDGIQDAERAELDALVNDGLGLSKAASEAIRRWADANRPPAPRRAPAETAEERNPATVELR